MLTLTTLPARSTRRLAALALAATSLAAVAGPSVAAPKPLLLLPNMAIAEGDAGDGEFIVNVSLSRPNNLGHTVTVDAVDFTGMSLPDGSGTYGSATPGEDYEPFGSVQLSFAPGEQVARFAVKIHGDTVVEGDEEIDVRFVSTEFDVADNDIDLILTNDDGDVEPSETPVLRLPNQSVLEPDKGCYVYQVSVMLSQPANLASSIVATDFTTVPLPDGSGTYGSATPGSDYKAFDDRRLKFRAGTRSAILPVKVCGDNAVEGDEEIDVRFVSSIGAIDVQDNDIDLILDNDD